MTLRESFTTILAHLQASNLLTGVNVDYGVFGSMPSVTPSLLLYIEPEDGDASQKGSATRKVKLRIFGCYGGETNPILAALGAVELCERIEQIMSKEEEVILEMNEKPPQFDDYYSDFAAAYIDFHIIYEPTQE
jgi:hypothetical protein